ncbi:hypothetical protein QW131_03090 [Roseibium salinum]|nr:hypothetical protein [Roseibium salinum]
MSTDTETHQAGQAGQTETWFEAAKKIYPMATHGKFRRIKWGLLFPYARHLLFPAVHPL